MKIGPMTRRRFVFGALLAAPFLTCADARWLEPEWLKTRHIKLSADKPFFRLVHFTDVHHKGDRAYLERVARQINAFSPDAVCFTGDIVEKKHFVREALEIFSQIKSPIFGVPGNHDYWSDANFGEIQRALAKGGGAWLLDEQRMLAGGRVCLSGATCLRGRPETPPPAPHAKNIMALHYPLMADLLAPRRYDLILAGHSHGGQVRLPFYGAIMVPYWVGRYDMGLFQTAAGPLYVNPGIGYLVTRVRFCCRPEITVFDI